MYGWIWIAVIVLAVIIEVLTDQLIAVWFIPGAMIGVVMDFLGGKEIWQILVVLVTTCIGIIIGRLFLTKKLKTSVTKTNVEAIIGERCIVTEKIDNFAGCGQAKVKGQIWSARGINDDDVFEIGDVLRIVAIEGVNVICKKD